MAEKEEVVVVDEELLNQESAKCEAGMGGVYSQLGNIQYLIKTALINRA